MANSPRQQGIPTVARQGAKQYFELARTERDPQGPYGHLSANVQRHSLSAEGDWPVEPYTEVVSDALYIPDALKPDDSPLGDNDVFVVSSVFTFGKYGGRGYEGKFRLGVSPVGGQSRVNVLKALLEERPNTAINPSDGGDPVLKIASETRGEDTKATLSNPEVSEASDGKLVRHERVSEDARTILRLLLAPVLDHRVKRVGWDFRVMPRSLTLAITTAELWD